MKRKKVKMGIETVAYRYSYLLAFVLAFVVYFGRRYVPVAWFVMGNWSSIGLSLAVALWNIRRKGLGLVACLGFAAAAGLYWLLPPALWRGPASFSLMHFFLLGPAIDQNDTGFIRRLFYIKLLLGMGIALAYIWGYLPDITGYNYQKELTLHSYGFMHPNSLSMYFASVLMDYYLMKKTSVSVMEWLATAVISILIFMSTDSRLGAVISLVVLAAAAAKPYLTSRTLPSWLLVIGIASCFTVGILLSHFYQEGDPFFDYMNVLFTKRPGNANTYIRHYGYRMWPDHFPYLYFKSGRLRHNENFYVDALLRFGTVAYSFFPVVLLVQLFRKRFTIYTAIFIWLAFATAMIEDYGMSLLICSALLFNYWQTSKPAPLLSREEERELL